MTQAVSPSLVLASGSPRRRALLRSAGVAFEVIVPEIEETARPSEAPPALAERLAREKADAVAGRVADGPRRLVLGADTIVLIGGRILGKPSDPEDAVRLLSQLLGHTHRVLTGVALADTGGAPTVACVVSSRVRMRSASEEEIRGYVAGGEPLDKAGAYAVQGGGRRFIEAIEGSESNVIGLPLRETLALLRAAGFPLESAA